MYYQYKLDERGRKTIQVFCQPPAKELAVGLQCTCRVGVRYLPREQATCPEALGAQPSQVKTRGTMEGLRRFKLEPTVFIQGHLPANGFFCVSTPQITMAKLKEKLGINWCLCSLRFDKSFRALSCHLTGAHTKCSDI